jgi:hypothetical protein
MDTSSLVVEEIEAGAEFLTQMHKLRPVKAACWLRESEEEERYLYVALEGLTVDNSDVAYGEVLSITRAMKDHYLDPFRVKLISTGEPVARAILDIYRRFPDSIPNRFDGRIFAGSAVSEVYIYPQFKTKPGSGQGA